jgi:hypothetical protein
MSRQRLHHMTQPTHVPKQLYRISYRDLCFAVECSNDTVVFAAPCAKWMVGKDQVSCFDYWRKRGAEILELNKSIQIPPEAPTS